MATAITRSALFQDQPAGSGWEQIHEIPCGIVAEMSVRGFTVRDLLLLQTGTVVNSKQSSHDRVTLRANGSLLAWADLEAVNGHLGVRLMDLG